MAIKVIIIFVVILVILILTTIYILYQNDPTPTSTPATGIPNAWSKDVPLTPCQTYVYPVQEVDGVYIMQPTMKKDTMDSLTPSPIIPDCINSNQMTAQLMTHTCSNTRGVSGSTSNCYKQDGTLAEYGEVEEYYKKCGDPIKCKTIVASLSLANQTTCSDMQRRCIDPETLTLHTCNPTNDLFVIRITSGKGISSQMVIQKYYYTTDTTDVPQYLTPIDGGDRLAWSVDIYYWSLSGQNIGDGSGQVLGSLDGINIRLIPYSPTSNFWQNFQYINLGYYNIVLKSLNCPCSGCFQVVPST